MPTAIENRAGATNARAPAAVIDEIAGDQRGAGDAEIAPDAVDGEAHAGAAPFLDHDRQPDRMIDRREDADDEQADADLQRRLGNRRCQRGEPDADEEHHHHAMPAPFVGEPACRQRKYSEREEARGRVFQQVGVAEAPFPRQRQRRDGGEYQREQMVEEMADVEQQELHPVTRHFLVPRNFLGSVTVRPGRPPGNCGPNRMR